MIQQAQRGDKAALAKLVKEHQSWLFNLVLRMIPDFHQAEDLTQDITIKAILKIHLFKGDCRFRTWLYCVAVNYILDSKETPIERQFHDFRQDMSDEEVSYFMAETLPDTKRRPHDLSLIAQEIEIKCMLGMLLCLDRKPRMVYILGDILSVDGHTGSRIMNLSETNFRQILSRARRRLLAFLSDRCSLINPGKPCTCQRSIACNLRTGYVDPLKLVFRADNPMAIREVVAGVCRKMNNLAMNHCRDLYRAQPFHASPDYSSQVQAIVDSPEFRDLVESLPQPIPLSRSRYRV